MRFVHLAGCAALGVTAWLTAGAHAEVVNSRWANTDSLILRTSRATGVARFVTAREGSAIDVPPPAGQRVAEPADFFSGYGHLFGISDSSKQLVLEEAETDDLGFTHTTFKQVHENVPVFAGLLRIHSNPAGETTAANGTFVPDIEVNTAPALGANEAATIAIKHVTSQQVAPVALTAANSKLYVFRTNLARGVPGVDHLVYEVEVGNGAYIREFVYVDAHKGRVVDQITGICDAIDRIVYSQNFDVPSIIWTEVDPWPTVFGVDVNNIIEFSEDTYNLFASATNGAFLSWDGTDGTMHAVNDDVTMTCPNAQWTGTFAGFCLGVTGDDAVAHEWAHAYTESTHDLIYQWQPGALNEAYSDIHGEVVDFINGRGTDSPIPLRTSGDCSIYSGSPPPDLTINSPAGIAGTYPAAGANFNPTPPVSVTADVELVNDGVGNTSDGCETPFVGFTAGNIALIGRGTCSLVNKALNAAAAGAVGVIIANNEGDIPTTMPGAGSPGIPSVMIGQSDGDAIRAELPGVSATITLGVATADSYRWLHAEDNPAYGAAARDMWNPTCKGHPGKVGDRAQYWCHTGDGGGVHTNSGVPNHCFALTVDGGSYNGQTITGIGLTKAFHIYWRAQTVYQVPASDFADHADALEASCTDLIGIDLLALSAAVPSGSLSGEIITAGDCDELAKAVLATELRSEPTFCGFTPMLDPNAPQVCRGEASDVYFEDWESGLGAWTVGTREVADPDTFDTPDWAVVSGLPDGRPGSAAFVATLPIGDCVDDTEAGVLYLESPTIAIPANVLSPGVVFTHWVATECGWDGGNVKISVDGGPFTLVPGTAFTFNPYPTNLFSPTGNPLAGEWAFTGTDGGSVGGSWGESHIDLTGIVAGEGDVVLRFEMGLDGCDGMYGWYVDDVTVFYCVLDCNGNGDGDVDGDVELDDYAGFELCLLGPGGGLGAGCDCFDFDTDGDVDLHDFGEFQAAFTGP